MYVVVAVSEAPGPPDVRPGPGWRVRTTTVPVGIRHAASRVPEQAHALCGADITGWTVFPDQEFQPRHGASCQRCGQLVTDVKSSR
jgi:hypothetical protein